MALIFDPSEPPQHGIEDDCVIWYGYDGAQRVVCYLTREALDKWRPRELDADGKRPRGYTGEERKRLYTEGRELINRIAIELYERGQFMKGRDKVFITVDDVKGWRAR